MSVIIVLIGISLAVAICFMIAFVWAVRSGQYEDDYTPSVRILFDSEKTPVTSNPSKPNKHVDRDLSL